MTTQVVSQGALISRLINQTTNKSTAEIAYFALGVCLLALLAQVAIPLPWTPVPITGQTFGVALIALLWGRKRGPSVVASYLALGALGLPIFAGGSTWLLGATSGYLIGMFFSSMLVGSLADRGFASTWLGAFFCATLGSFIVFLFGVLVLSFYLPGLSALSVVDAIKALAIAGVLPFLPGDVLKNSLAALIASRANKY